MKANAPQSVQLSEFAGQLASENAWEYQLASSRSSRDVAGQTHDALQSPLEFPSIEAAIVDGDRVALAVDPNVPQVCEVLTGILKTLAMTEAGGVDIVLWDEASDATMDAVREIAGNAATVHRHDSCHRESLRYLAADKEATPIYLNRLLVDADFVLPVVSSRTMDALGGHDLTGVFPSLADSATRHRHRQRMVNTEMANDDGDEAQIPWLLGVHMIVAVDVNTNGSVADVVAGTPEAIRHKIKQEKSSSETSTQQDEQNAELVIASLDGDAQQQTWANAARALAAATRYVAVGGTIVLWTAIKQPPHGPLAHLDDIDDASTVLLTEPVEAFALGDDNDDESELDFPRWDEQLSTASTFARILAEHRVVLRSLLSNDAVEPIGVGIVEDETQLVHLSKSFSSCGILRSAQFADSTVDAPHRLNDKFNQND
ncbi:MAG: hypothetical protein WBD20_25600 [Pirellulaceae bacterium]